MEARMAQPLAPEPAPPIAREAPAAPAGGRTRGRGVPGSWAAGARPALGLVAIVVLAEYLARRVLAPALPVLGSPTVNDLLAVVVAYAPLVALTAAPGARTPAALGRTLRALAGQARTWPPWAGGVLFLGAVLALAPLDARLWGTVRLPAVTLPPAPVVLFAGAGVPLSVASLLLVNGLFVPLVEERLWRGLIQPGLGASWGLLPGLLGAAALFSLKHAVVDASLGRLLALTAGGLVLGTVALRAGGRTGWWASAVSHAGGNTVATAIFLATRLGA
jgi:membrane protease YdiL (CAAX protease family)